MQIYHAREWLERMCLSRHVLKLKGAIDSLVSALDNKRSCSHLGLNPTGGGGGTGDAGGSGEGALKAARETVGGDLRPGGEPGT